MSDESKMTMLTHKHAPGPHVYCNDCTWTPERHTEAVARKHARENRGHRTAFERINQTTFRLFDLRELATPASSVDKDPDLSVLGDVQ